MVLASSHLLLVTNGAVIGGAREFTSAVSNKWSSNWWCSEQLLVTNGSVIGGVREFTSVVSN